MLTRLTIKNFRSLVNVDVPLRPLTVLIGRNDSGKSTFLDAIERLANQSPPVEADHYRFDNRREPQIDGLISNGDRVEINRKGRTKPHPSISPAQLYNKLPANGVSMTSEGYDDRNGAVSIGADGSGVPSFLDHLLRTDRARFDRIVDETRRRVPGLSDIAIPTPDKSKRRIDLILESGFRMEADQASAGVRILLFFIALAYHPNPPRLILLEEPETGLHPRRLAEVMKLLREITRGEHGDHAAQVVLTTHSPYLLDCVDIETDQVLVFRRNDDGSRSVEPVDLDGLSLFLDEFQLGEVWYNEGEEALVKK